MTEVEICNQALDKIGEEPIVSLTTPRTKREKVCARHYSVLRDAVLREHEWGFASRTVTLSPLAGVEPVGWDLAYVYPPDCLEVRRMYQESFDAENPVKYKIGANIALSSREIWTDEPDAILEYTARIVAPNMFDASFVEMLACKLASVIAIPLTQNLKLEEKWFNRYAILLAFAEKNDAKEESNAEDEVNVFLDARA